MTPFISDSDFTLFVGDVRDVLAGLPDESVHCVVTSPPWFPLPELCERCYGRPPRDRHHKDGNPRNNDPANIAFLCRSCLRLTHNKQKRSAA